MVSPCHERLCLALHILVCTKWIVYLDLWMKHWISARVTKGRCLWICSIEHSTSCSQQNSKVNLYTNIYMYRDILLLNHRHQGTVLLEMSSIYSCDIPTRVRGREARHQGKERKNKNKQKQKQKQKTKDRQTDKDK